MRRPPRSGPVLAVALAVLLALAGCVAPTPDPGAGTDDADPPASGVTSRPASGDVAVAGGDLPVNATLVFRRVRSLTGRDVRPPTVTVRRLSEVGTFAGTGNAFYDALGLAETDLNLSRPGGLTRADGSVAVYPGVGSPATVERVVAHEFVHVVQFRSGMVDGGRSFETTDRALARAAAVEGGAVFVTDAYVRRHLPDATRQSAAVIRRYRAGPAGNRLFYARYRFGYRYVNATVDSPADLGAVYDAPPRTTERLRHPGTDGSPRPLSVAANASASPWRVALRDTQGELVVRVALRSQLNRSRAAAGADGWGNDSLVVFRRGPRFGFAWTLRWDDPGNASEFADAFRTYLDRRGETSASSRLERVDEETAVVLVGDGRFVANAAATGDAAGVTVAAPS